MARRKRQAPETWARAAPVQGERWAPVPDQDGGSARRAARLLRPVVDAGGTFDNHPGGIMAKAELALLATLHAKPGREEELEAFLRGALPLANAEPGTTSWFALRIDDSTYGIFDTFAESSAREAHLSGEIASALMEKAPDLLAEDPDIRKVDVLAAKLP